MESKVRPAGVQLKRKCDWVDHQAYSLLHYIYVITNNLIMRNDFSKLR